MLRILACLLLFPLGLVAQPFRFSHLNQRDGLSQNTVTTVLRDSEGLIWMGTQDGLNVYDGYNFTIYRHNRMDTTSLSDNYVLKLAEDNYGRIWVATRNGLCFFDKQERHFFRYYTSKKERVLDHNQISFLHIFKNGEIVYTSPETATVCLKESKPNSKIFIRLKNKESEFLGFLYCSADDSQQVYIDKKTIRVEERNAPQNRFLYNRQNSKSIITAIDSKQNTFFIIDSLSVKLVHWKKSTPPTTIFTLESLPTAMLVDARGDVWIGTLTSLVVIRSPGTLEQQQHHIKNDKNNAFSLAANQIESLYESADGLIWVGTVGGGVSVFDPLQNDFHLQLSTSSDGLSNGPVWMTYSFANYFLAGTSDAAFLFPKNKRVPQWWQLIPQGKKYTSACMDKHGTLWLGARNEGLVVIDTLARKRLEIAGTNLLEGKQVMDIQNGPDESVWFCCIGGLYRYVRSENRIEDYNQPAGKEPLVAQRYFSAIRFTSSGVAWIASNVGLLRVIPETRETKLYKNKPNEVNSLSYNLINDICLDADARIWIATMGSGFDLLDLKTETFTNYSTFQGLPNNTVYALEKDQSGKIWMSTNEGIVCFDPTQKTFSNYTVRDGLSSNEFVIRTHAQDAEGRIYFGSADGLMSFHPQQLNQRNFFSKPILKAVAINFIPSSPQKLNALTHQERNLSFEFTAVDFRLQDKIQYAYQLVGFDAEWRENRNGNRVATYTNLPYGDYRFRVRFRINKDAWSKAILEIPVHIQTPFWATTWFLISVVLLSVLVLAVAIRYFAQRRLRQRLRALEIANKIQEEKERISRDLHDNVGAQLTYIISSLDHVAFRLEKEGDLNPARKKVNDLSEYSRLTMQQLRESIWAINSESIKLSEMLARLQEHLQLLAENNEDIEVRSERTGQDQLLPPARSIEVFRILQEGISNAFKHAQATQLMLLIAEEPNHIRFQLSDNGKGFDTEHDKVGHYGLKNMRQRAARSGIAFELKSQVGKGTVLILILNKE